jgi:hypothetical protein
MLCFLINPEYGGDMFIKNPVWPHGTISQKAKLFETVIFWEVPCWRHYAMSWKVVGSIPSEAIGFFNWPNASSCTMALGLTQPLTEMSTRILPGHKGQLMSKVDNFTTICELNV